MPGSWRQQGVDDGVLARCLGVARAARRRGIWSHGSIDRLEQIHLDLF